MVTAISPAALSHRAGSGDDHVAMRSEAAGLKSVAGAR